MINYKLKTVGIFVDGMWRLITIEGNRTPDGILQPPLALMLNNFEELPLLKITKKGNWLYAKRK